MNGGTMRVLLTLVLSLLPALGPDDPVCEPGVPEPCVQPMLPEERTGQAVGDGSAPAAEPATGAPAYTG